MKTYIPGENKNNQTTDNIQSSVSDYNSFESQNFGQNNYEKLYQSENSFSQGIQYKRVPDKQKNGILGIVALILTCTVILSLIGFILAIIDIVKNDGNKKTLSYIAITISGSILIIFFIFGVAGSGNRFNGFDTSRSSVENTETISHEDSASDINNKSEVKSNDKNAENVIKQLDIFAEETLDGQMAVFITNNSKTIIDELEVQINYLDDSGNTIDMYNDGHDMILPGYTVVSRMDEPENGFSDYNLDYEISIGDHPKYVNHSDDIVIESNPGDDCIIVKVTNNSDVEIDEIEFDVIVYKGDDIVTITYPQDIYHVLPGSTETEKVSVYNIKTYQSLKYGTDYDDIEVILNQAHTFGYNDM